jgi:hypothetical protein
MNKAFLTGLFAAMTTITGVLAATAPANAFSWNNSWRQPTIHSKQQTGFNDQPFQQFVQSERVELKNSGQFILDPNKLRMKYAHDVAVYFINEGAGYRNKLAYEAKGATNQTGLIFNDIASRESILPESNGPLKKGDGVKLGRIAAGTQLDFWLKTPTGNLFTTQTASNLDRLQHVVAYAYNNYILLGFEDLYGDRGQRGVDPLTGKNYEASDRDFNDTVFVLDMGEDNVRALVPEPSITLGLVGLGIAGALGLRRNQKANSVEES